MADFASVLARMVREYGGFIAANRERAERRGAALAEFEKDAKNMFAGVFKFRLEEFHSETLRRFLDPETPETGDRRFSRVFLELLERVNPEVKTSGFGERITVEREAGGAKADGRIDLLVYDDRQAVIIENKINNAPDQPNQLAKYVKSVQSRGKEAAAVVYIPQFEGVEPPLEGYDGPWREYVPEIRRKLVILPAIDRRGDEKGGGVRNDLARGFIGECLRLEGLKDRQNYILSEYGKLLRTMEEKSKMTETIDREFIKEFYKDKQSIETAEHIYEIWDNREKLLGCLIQQSLRDKLKSELYHERDNYPPALYKKIDDEKSFVFHSDPDDDYKLHLGFCCEREEMRGRVRKALEKVIKTALLDGGWFKEASDWNDPKYGWLTSQFLIGEYKEPLPEIERYFLAKVKDLEKAASSLEL
jgi:hypothetical protein